MSEKIHALAASEARGKLSPYQYDPGELAPDHVEIAVDYCGLCHSDLSMINNEWWMTKYPFVPGHEVIGKVVAAGSAVQGLLDAPGNPVGRTVGLGWFSKTCMACKYCLSGDQNLCQTAEQTIVGRNGGFASRVRCHWTWAIPLPEALDVTKAGPLFCAGVTVFNPIIQNHVQPTDRVGVIGIGGLGHLALQFLNKWGCEVYAFSSNPSKRDEILSMGAHHVVNSKDPNDFASIKGSLNFLVSTVNVPLDWEAMLATLTPKGRLHFVGVVTEPIPLNLTSILLTQKSITGTPAGSASTLASMLQFCARHNIETITEQYPMSQANEAVERLESGKARYRIVLKNDLQ